MYARTPHRVLEGARNLATEPAGDGIRLLGHRNAAHRGVLEDHQVAVADRVGSAGAVDHSLGRTGERRCRHTRRHILPMSRGAVVLALAAAATVTVTGMAGRAAPMGRPNRSTIRRLCTDADAQALDIAVGT